MPDQPYLEVVDPGAGVVTDLGRFAGPPRGLSVNGALDQFAARAANALVGNAQTEPLVELGGLGLAVRSTQDALVAVTGAPTRVEIDGRPHQQWEPLALRAGRLLRIGRSDVGLRSYLAVHGSFDVPRLLGSCAPDSMIGFGVRLAAGTAVAMHSGHGPIHNPHFGSLVFSFGLPGRSAPGRRAVLDVIDGPDAAEFGDEVNRLFDGPYTVSPQSNHVGLRLGGGRIPRRAVTGEVLSRGVPVGAVEVPTGDELLVLMRGRGVTAGYPVLAVLTSRAQDRAAQLRPGQEVRFRRTTAAAAAESYRRERQLLDRVEARARIALAENRRYAGMSA
jgi:5-oxoprolinase (ATP-hydrolysing) subunit C